MTHPSTRILVLGAGIAGLLFTLRQAVVSFVVTATLSQRRFPGLFVWPGKGRYEQAQRLQLAKEEHPSQPVHRLS